MKQAVNVPRKGDRMKRNRSKSIRRRETKNKNRKNKKQKDKEIRRGVTEESKKGQEQPGGKRGR